MAVAVFAVVAAVVAWLDWTRQRARTHDLHHFVRSEVRHLAEQINGELAIALSELDGLAFWVGEEPGLEIDRFERYSEKLRRRHPALRRTALLAGDVVTATYPRNAALLGVDVGHHTRYGPAVDEMRRLGAGLVTGPVSLPHSGSGVILRTPVWTTSEAGQDEYWGHVGGTFDTAGVQQVIQTAAARLDVRLQVADADDDGATRGLRLGAAELERSSDWEPFEFDVPGERWAVYAAGPGLSAGGLHWGRLGLGAVFAALCGLAAALLGATSARLRDTNRQLQRLATTDPLTEASNRRAILHACRSELTRVGRGAGPFAAIMVDLDRFKEINDTWGHRAGDAVLRHVASAFRHAMRAVDDVGRWGGEEFLIVAPQTDAPGAREFAERLRKLIKHARVPFDGEHLQVTASFGFAISQPGDSAESLIERADVALYRAKTLGRDRTEAEVLEVASKKLSTPSTRRTTLRL